MTGRIDAHQHFWRVDRADYGWLTPALATLYRDFGPAELAPLLAEAGIAQTILVQAAPTVAETEYLLGIARDTSFVAGVDGRGEPYPRPVDVYFDYSDLHQC